MASERSVAVVTGCAQGLGHAIVEELLIEGFRVCMTDINAEKGNFAAQELQKVYGDSNVIFRACDVTQKSSLISVFGDVLKEFKKIDLMVNNAGIVNEFDPRKTIDINLMGTIYSCEVAIKYMASNNGGKGGIVVNVASLAGLIPTEMAPVYAASKHGIVGLTKSYGTEYHYKKSNIIFCALCPSFINTPMLENLKSLTLRPDIEIPDRNELLDPTFVAKGAMKLIKDKRNGAVLVVEKNVEYKYIELEELKIFSL